MVLVKEIAANDALDGFEADRLVHFAYGRQIQHAHIHFLEFHATDFQSRDDFLKLGIQATSVLSAELWSICHQVHTFFYHWY